ncbi:MAG TPA: multidrug ABC transporter permease, partial [Myxococcota bacterium]
MIAALRTTRAMLSTMYAYMTEYRAELLLWALANSLSFILMGVWHQAAERADVGITPDGVVRYFLAVFLVRQLTMVWVIWDFEPQVLKGTLGNQLLLPVDPVWKHVAGHVGERLARAPFVVLLVAVFFALYPQGFFVPSLTTTLTFLALCAAAFVLRFIIQYTLAMGCFWTERMSSLEQINFLLYMFCGGAIAP